MPKEGIEDGAAEGSPRPAKAGEFDNPAIVSETQTEPETKIVDTRATGDESETATPTPSEVTPPVPKERISDESEIIQEFGWNSHDPNISTLGEFNDSYRGMVGNYEKMKGEYFPLKKAMKAAGYSNPEDFANMIETTLANRPPESTGVAQQLAGQGELYDREGNLTPIGHKAVVAGLARDMSRELDLDGLRGEVKAMRLDGAWDKFTATEDGKMWERRKDELNEIREQLPSNLMRGENPYAVSARFLVARQPGAMSASIKVAAEEQVEEIKTKRKVRFAEPPTRTAKPKPASGRPLYETASEEELVQMAADDYKERSGGGKQF